MQSTAMAANIYPNGFSLFRSRVGHAFAEIGKTKNLVHSSEKQCEQRRYIPLDRAAQSAGNVSGPNGNFVPDSNSHIQKKMRAQLGDTVPLRTPDQLVFALVRMTTVTAGRPQ
jgi:hypothetical protein